MSEKITCTQKRSTVEQPVFPLVPFVRGTFEALGLYTPLITFSSSMHAYPM